MLERLQGGGNRRVALISLEYPLSGVHLLFLIK